MADTGTWVVQTNVEKLEGTVVTMTAGADIYAGMVVAFAGTGVSWTVQPCVAGTTGPVAGVAVTDALSGEVVSVCVIGGIYKVLEGPGTGIDAGDFVEADDAAATGCVKVAVVTGTISDGVGQALEDIAANGSGYIVVKPFTIQKAAT
jgi:hypothetical protein